MELLSNFITHYGYAAILILLMLGIFGIPLPDEILLTFVGYLASTGELNYVITLLIVVFGSCCGISLNYAVGRAVAANLLPRLRFAEHGLANLRERFKRHGGWVLFFGWLLPGVRHWLTLGAGTLKLPSGLVAISTFPATLIWSLFYVTLGYLLGEEGPILLEKMHSNLRIAAAAMVLLFLGYVLLRGRRRASPTPPQPLNL